MPTTLPRTVRDAWGEEVADEFSSWLDENFQQRTVSRDEFREILGRLDVLEERFDRQDARFEERLEAQNKRFDERFDEVGARLDRMEKRFGSMDEKLDRMNERIFSTTRWLGLLVLFVTMATVLLSIAQFTG
jgi:tetrahydromethanopterin S-methyltransferase subunit G